MNGLPIALGQLDLFSSDDFAALLGLKTAAIDGGLSEEKCLYRLSTYIQRNALAPEADQDKIWSQFCAAHLPATVHRYLSPDPGAPAMARIFSPASEVLVQLQHSPYFAKFLRSSAPAAASGKQLPRVVAERVAECGCAWEPALALGVAGPREEQYVSVLGSAMQLLGTMCACFVKAADQEAVVPQALRERLLPLLRAWARRYRGQFFGDVAARLCMAWGARFKGSVFEGGVRTIRKRALGWEECGLPGCGVRTGLKACGRCQTVRYCTPAHQQMHWKYATDPGVRHNQLCHKTEY